jgi:hypothetical protein
VKIHQRLLEHATSAQHRLPVIQFLSAFENWFSCLAQAANQHIQTILQLFVNRPWRISQSTLSTLGCSCESIASLIPFTRCSIFIAKGRC